MSKRPAPDDAFSAAKKLKSDNAASSSGGDGGSALSVADRIAQAKADIARKLASMNIPAKPVAPTPAPASLPARPGATSTTPTSASAAPPTFNVADIAKQVAEAKRRAAASLANKAVQENPYLSVPQQGRKKAPLDIVPHGTGLKMAAHPLLLDTTPVAPQSNKDRYKPMQPKFASIKANARLASSSPSPAPVASRPLETTPKINPYAGASSTLEGGFEGAPREKIGRTFRFNQKGKYVALAEQMRSEAQLEALKQRIAERAGKAGLDSEFEVLEKNIRREAPPDAEWWDAPLLPNKTYNDLDLGMEALKIRSEDSPITLYVQHPIPIPAPWDKNAVELKPLKLTKKEMQKMRRQRRKAEQQDKQDRIRMGLIPPDPPKVRLSNIMKVLTSDAVQDPTKVEARVRREVAQRKMVHEKANAAAKLTPEQRREKIENKKVEEEKKGLFGAVYKIKTLSDPSHRFKVRKNAEQLGLTGMTIFNPNFALVVVEGSSKALKSYDRLLTARIEWTVAAEPRRAGAVDADEEEGDADGTEEIALDKGKTAEEAPAVSLEDNRCDKIWGGALRDRAYKAFRARNCPTDTMAKEALGSKWAGQWDVAKHFQPEEEL